MRLHQKVGRLLAALGTGALLVGGAAATATVAQASTPTAGHTQSGQAPHVMTIMMENTDYSQFAGSPAMPYLNELAHEYADFTQAYGWTYPSLPNYLELLSGSDDGTAGSDCDITDPGCSNFTNTKLVDQLEAAGISWHGYYQGDASGCDQSDGGGNYPYWHNPFRYFADFSSQCQYLSNFDDLIPELSSQNPPSFNWVVPDLVNSGGDNGTMSSGDAWLAGELPQIMATNWYRDGGQIVIIYDTGYNDAGGNGGASGGQIPLVVVSAQTRGMGTISTPVNTAGVLHSIEQAYGLSYLGDAANADNGSLGDALVAGLPSGHAAPDAFTGATLETDASSANAHARVTPIGGGVLGLEGAATIPGSVQAPGNLSQSTIEVGLNAQGEGVVVTPEHDVVSAPGTSVLESVSCTSASQCYAVGLGPSNDDEGVLTSIVNGVPVSTTPLPAFIGLYGISCPSSTTCYAVGYDNANDADAVTTITNGVAGSPVEVNYPGGAVEWLNAISCPTATTCYAAGLIGYNPSIVPITSGAPGNAVAIPNSWYVNGLSCTAAGSCVAVGENTNEQGVVTTYANGAIGTTTVVPGTEYLYGAGCTTSGDCILTGASTQNGSGYSTGVVVRDDAGVLGSIEDLPTANGFGQVVCSTTTNECLSVGAVLAN